MLPAQYNMTKAQAKPNHTQIKLANPTQSQPGPKLTQAKANIAQSQPSPKLIQAKANMAQSQHGPKPTWPKANPGQS